MTDAEPEGRLHVCVVSLNAYPAMAPEAGRGMGGLEAAAWALAQGLVDKDTRVSFVLRHTARPPDRLAGVELHTIVDRWRDVRHSVAQQMRSSSQSIRRRLGVRLLGQLLLLAVTRYFRDRRPTAEQIRDQLLRLQPDVVIALGTGSDQAAVVRTAQELQRPSLIWLQSNADLDQRIFEQDDYVNPYGEPAGACRFVLQQATAVVCQSQAQQQQLRRLTARPAHYIRTPLETTRWGADRVRTDGGDYVLWIGRYDRFHKRPHLAVQIAAACPQMPFRLVLNPGDAAVAAELCNQFPENVQVVDYVPADQMPAQMRQARLFLSTGAPEFEGFPTAFLEAAAAGTPIVSLHDFDQFLADSSCGYATDGDLCQAARLLATLWEDTQQWKTCSCNGQTWVQQHHAHEAVMRHFRQVIEQLCQGSPPVQETAFGCDGASSST